MTNAIEEMEETQPEAESRKFVTYEDLAVMGFKGKGGEKGDKGKGKGKTCWACGESGHFARDGLCGKGKGTKGEYFVKEGSYKGKGGEKGGIRVRPPRMGGRQKELAREQCTSSMTTMVGGVKSRRMTACSH